MKTLIFGLVLCALTATADIVSLQAKYIKKTWTENTLTGNTFNEKQRNYLESLQVNIQRVKNGDQLTIVWSWKPIRSEQEQGVQPLSYSMPLEEVPKMIEGLNVIRKYMLSIPAQTLEVGSLFKNESFNMVLINGKPKATAELFIGETTFVLQQPHVDKLLEVLKRVK
jgi:hypothetical protein